MGVSEYHIPRQLLSRGNYFQMVKYLFPSSYNLQMLHLFLLCVSSITLLIIFASRPFTLGQMRDTNQRQILSKQNKEVSIVDKIFI